ncbi:MAG: STAS domain-containing protein [Acidobacteria bacterium]|nr:STAS domain-containing protein [Acidobacteriaceae bacterium]MBV9608741.1 STAS domain-containing protein [Acidobacteriota bacterium]
MKLQTGTRSIGKVAVIDCHGSIVFGEEITMLRDHVKNVLTGSRQIVLNLADVRHIDSTGVGALVGLYTSARYAGGNLKLAGLTGGVKDVLQLTRLGTILETYPSAEEAAESFKKEAGRTVAAEWAG